jgi:Fur family zinc uptake transcriptional regulator
MAMTSKPLSATQQRVLALLAEAGKPLSAYDLLARLKDEGVNAPPTVYRALERLMRDGLAHRIESLNAFVACSHPHHQEWAAFVICDHCGAVSEATDPELRAHLDRVAGRAGFHATRMTVELHGHCASCAGSAHAHPH